MDIRDEVLKVEGRLARRGLHTKDLHRESGVAASTWERWKRGAHGPQLTKWNMCLAAADRLCGPAGER